MQPPLVQPFQNKHLCYLPRCPDITVDEFHRHLAVDNLDDVHRGPSHLALMALRVAGSLSAL